MKHLYHKSYFVFILLHIGDPILVPPSAPTQPANDSSLVFVTCGQNITVPLFREIILIFMCDVFNGSEPMTKEIFKNGELIANIFSKTINPFGSDDFGKYTFVASHRICGSASAVSWIYPGEF